MYVQQGRDRPHSFLIASKKRRQNTEGARTPGQVGQPAAWYSPFHGQTHCGQMQRAATAVAVMATPMADWSGEDRAAPRHATPRGCTVQNCRFHPLGRREDTPPERHTGGRYFLPLLPLLFLFSLFFLSLVFFPVRLSASYCMFYLSCSKGTRTLSEIRSKKWSSRGRIHFAMKPCLGRLGHLGVPHRRNV